MARKKRDKPVLTNEQFTAIAVALLGVLQLILHLWSDYRRQQQTKTLMSKPIHLELTLTDLSSTAPKVIAKVNREPDC